MQPCSFLGKEGRDCSDSTRYKASRREHFCCNWLMNQWIIIGKVKKEILEKKMWKIHRENKTLGFHLLKQYKFQNQAVPSGLNGKAENLT